MAVYWMSRQSQTSASGVTAVQDNRQNGLRLSQTTANGPFEATWDLGRIQVGLRQPRQGRQTIARGVSPWRRSRADQPSPDRGDRRRATNPVAPCGAGSTLSATRTCFGQERSGVANQRPRAQPNDRFSGAPPWPQWQAKSGGRARCMPLWQARHPAAWARYNVRHCMEAI